MERFIRIIVILGIIIGFPILADYISNIITIGMIMKCIYLTLGLSAICIFKEAI